MSRLPFALGSVALALTALFTFALAGCSQASHSSAGGWDTSGSSGAGGSENAGPCDEGATKKCGVTLGYHDGVLSCYEGTQVCVGGVFGPCGGGQVVETTAPEGSNSPGLQAQALGPASSCAKNPCDPTCQTFDEKPDGGLTPDGGGATYDWKTGKLSDLPPGLVNKGLEEPCQSGSDCQFNQACVEPKTDPSCAHSKCATGAGLDPGCDPCVQAVCAKNPSCCPSTYTTTCTHDLCSTGSKLKSSCDPCVQQVCAAKPACCKSSWDSSCVAAVTSVCKLSCPLSSPGTWAQACVDAVATECDAQCGTAPPPPAACSHSVCASGKALDAGCHSCAQSICAVDPYCCKNSWDSDCVQEVKSVCAQTCPVDMTPTSGPPPESGQCVPWLPGQTDPSCSGVDLALGVPCDNTVPVCNHGNATAPAGVQLIHFPANSNQYPKCNPDQTQPQMKTCTTSAPIPPGQCISVACPSLANGNREIMVNPPGGAHVDECSCLDNWSLSSGNVSCTAPSCVVASQVAEFKPVNLYVVVDKSGSMSGGKWTGTVSALGSFFGAASSAGLGAALEFFPLDKGSAFGDGCGASTSPGGTCASLPCQNPMVPLGKLTAASAPSDAQEGLLKGALAAVSPGGMTPTYPALDGALAWAEAAQAANAKELYVVVLVTDGDPTECNTSIGAIAALASTAYSGGGIRTYTVGMDGANVAALNQVAVAGGTKQAFVIQGTGDTQVAQQLAAAFQDIAGQNISCAFDLPPAGKFDPNAVTLELTTSAGVKTTLGRRTDSSSCAAGGWYYDDNSKPTKIQLCSSTCSQAQADPGSKAELTVGCPTSAKKTTLSQLYEASCPTATKPQWGYLSYDTSTPGSSSVTFRARTATTQSALSGSTFVTLATATSSPTDTQVCSMSGPKPCPLDLFSTLGIPAAKQGWLELEITLDPNNDAIPTVNDWQLTYSCPIAE